MCNENNIVINELNKLKKEKNNLILKCEGIKLEYEYVNSLKDRRIQELKAKLSYEKEKEIHYKEKLEEIFKKNEEYKKQLEQIRKSRWWKLRNILKGEK